MQPWPVVGHHLKAVLRRSGEARARRTDRIERQRPDMGRQNVLAVADEIQRTDLPV